MTIGERAAVDAAHVDTDEARTMPRDVRDALSWLAHLIDEKISVRTSENADEFAQPILGTDASGMVALREELGPFSMALVARAFGNDLGRHPARAMAGITGDESPIWQRLNLEDETIMVPCALVAAFDAGDVADVPLVVCIDARWSDKEFIVHARLADADAARAYFEDLMARAYGAENYLRGRCVSVTSDLGTFAVRQIAPPVAARSDVVVADSVWEEIDLNVSALFRRRALLTELGLGTNRGMILYGPPGTGKSAVCKVLAAELAGDVTVVFCSAKAIAGNLDDVYDELTRLSPALVLLEDIDLVVGKRSGGQEMGPHGFITALDGVMSRHQDVVTIATSNDVSVLDEAAVRAARFDRLIEIGLPDAAQRAAILERYLGPLTARVDVRVVADAVETASGADLRELVRRGVLTSGDALDTATLMAVVRDGSWEPRDIGMYL